jgi:hypothetical protein
VTLSNAALKALSSRNKMLVAEMELYFSCLIRKQVRFKESLEGEVINVTDQLAIRFRPVMTKSCGIDYEGDEPPLTDFPIQKADAFVPHWLKIDFKKDEWIGEFGF